MDFNFLSISIGRVEGRELRMEEAMEESIVFSWSDRFESDEHTEPLSLDEITEVIAELRF